MRILALHGKRQNAELMRTRLGRLVPKLKKVGVELFIAEAPHDLPLEEGETVPMKTWFERNASYEITENGNASLETTLTYLDMLWQDALSSDQPYSGVFGFSQGGTLSGIMSMMPRRYPGLQFAVIIGAPDNSFVIKEHIPPSIVSLHMGGSRDSMVPIHNSIGCSRDLCNKFTEAAFVIHEQGHCIPSRAADMRHIVEFWEKAVSLSNATTATNTITTTATTTTTKISTSATETAIEKEEEKKKEKEKEKEHPLIGSEAALEGQLEELEALRAIYEDTLLPLYVPIGVGDKTLKFSITLRLDTDLPTDLPITANISNKLKIVMCMPSLYLDENALSDGKEREMPSILLDTSDCNLLDFPLRYKRAVLAVMHTSAKECMEDNMQCSFNVIQAALDWLQDEGSYTSADSEKESTTGSTGTTGSTMTEIWKEQERSVGQAGDIIRPWYDGNDDDDDSGAEERAESEMIRTAVEHAAKEHRGRLLRLFHSFMTDDDGNNGGNGGNSGGDEKEAESVLLTTTSSSNGEDGTLREQEEEEEEEEEDGGSSGTSTLSRASSKGVWSYTVGLIGKPSAGKSSVFNVLSHSKNKAEVASHPFTTINPNIGYGYYRGPSDHDTTASTACSGVPGGVPGAPGVVTTSAILRDNATQRRLLPITIKDVAGLVPGAYKGRGKGNQFLNDLVDADALIHVVDVSGKSDDEGNIVHIDGEEDARGTDGNADTTVTNPNPNPNPVYDTRNGYYTSNGKDGNDIIATASWIREEVHRWIFNNAQAKWHTVVRRGATAKGNNNNNNNNKTSKTAAAGRGYSGTKTVFNRVYQLFSGYHVTKVLIRRAGAKARLNVDDADLWSRQDLHCFVAHFLMLRFPICLALNKVDLLSSKDSSECKAYIRHIQMKCIQRGELAIPMSAASELYLQEEGPKEGGVVNNASTHMSNSSSSIGINRSSNTSSRNASSSSSSSSSASSSSSSSSSSSASNGVAASMKESEREKLVSKVAIYNKFIAKLGSVCSPSMGVLAAVSAAVAMRPPIYVYPVGNIDTLMPLANSISKNTSDSTASTSTSTSTGIGSSSGDNLVLRDIVMMKPSSTVGDLVSALKDQAIPNLQVRGEFVRACGRAYTNGSAVEEKKESSSKKKQLGRESVLEDGHIIEICMNKKSVWQHKEK